MKPLGRRAYGSIGHLPCSRLGPSDSCVTEGQSNICTVKTRDKHDKIIVQEKLDGSNVAIAKVGGVIYPLTRAGYVADTSPYEQHHLFHTWALQLEDVWQKLLKDGERISGEWLAQAHGTVYDLATRGMEHPFAAFDLFTSDNQRLTFDEFEERRTWAEWVIPTPYLLHVGGAVPLEKVMQEHKEVPHGADEIEGVVYRVERKGKVDFLAKYVRPDKVDGKYLESVTGGEPVWNWRPY